MSDTLIQTEGGAYLDGNLQVGGDFIGRDQHNQYIGQVIVQIDQIQRAHPPTQWDGRNPYIGLNSFQEVNASLFFGREKLIGELVERVKDERFIGIAGPSGSGKSSLLQAGVIPALKQVALSNGQNWLIESFTPQDAPFEQLATAVDALAMRRELPPTLGNEIRTAGLTDFSKLHTLALRIARGPGNQRLIIVIDQFEELFTRTKDKRTREAFVKLLIHAAQQANGPVSVIIALRSDFISDIIADTDLHKVLDQKLQLIGAMEPKELVRAIVRPVLEVGAAVDPKLVAWVLADMQGKPGALPLMQFALRDLFESNLHRKGDLIELKLEEFLDRGGIWNALKRRADQALAKLDVEQQEISRVIFSHLIEPSNIKLGTVATRRAVTLTELMSDTHEPTLVKEVVARFVDERLLTTDKQEQHQTVTLAHERLIEAWPWLQKLLDENSEAITLRNQMNDDALVWNEKQRNVAFLYVGERLALVRQRLAGAQLTLSGIAEQFLAASMQEEHRRERTRYLGQAASGAIGAGIGYGLYNTVVFRFESAPLSPIIDPQQLNSATLLIAFVMFLLGEFIGFCLGLGLYRWRGQRVHRRIAVSMIGATAVSCSQLFYLLIISVNRWDVLLWQTITGALLGASLGFGITFTGSPRQKVFGTMIFTLVAGLINELWPLKILMTRSLPPIYLWLSPLMIILAAASLGGLTALGYAIAAIDENEAVDANRLFELSRAWIIAHFKETTLNH